MQNRLCASSLLRKISTRNVLRFSARQYRVSLRCASEAAAPAAALPELKDPFSAEAQQKRDENYAKIVSEWKAREYGYLSNLSLSQAQATEAMTTVFDEVKKLQGKLNEIAKTPNTNETIVQKFNQTYVLLSEIRQSVMKKYGIDDEHTFRYLVGQQSKASDELTNLVKSIYSFIAEQAFGIKSKYQFADGRAIAIYLQASSALSAHLCNSMEDLSRKYIDESKLDADDYLQNFSEKSFVEELVMPSLFTFEMDALKYEEDLDLAVRQNIAMFDDSIQKGIESVREGFAKEMAKRQGKTVEEKPAAAEETPLPVLEKQALATVEGWVNYKLQLAECLFRCSANDEAQPRYMTHEYVDEKVKAYKASGEKKEEKKE